MIFFIVRNSQQKISDLFVNDCLESDSSLQARSILFTCIYKQKTKYLDLYNMPGALGHCAVRGHRVKAYHDSGPRFSWFQPYCWALGEGGVTSFINVLCLIFSIIYT